MPNHTRIAFSALILLSCATAVQAQRGTIKGTVRFSGPETKRGWLLVHQDQAVCGDRVPSQHLQINHGRVRNVVVFLEGVSPADVRGKAVEIRARKCDFELPVQITERGADLELLNDDQISHTVQVLRSGEMLGATALRSGQSRTNRQVLDHAGRIDLRCQAHTWMQSSVWVFDHPYYALTNQDGTFEIPFVVPGTYTLTAWHSELGLLSTKVTVTANQTVPVEFAYRGLLAATVTR